MQAIDRFHRDLDAALRRSDGAPEPLKLEAMRTFFFGEFRKVPEETLAALFTTFLEKWRAGQDGALAWLRGVSSLLMMEFDGTSFSKEEWADIKESVVLSENEIDLELLSYVMGLVLEHGAL